MRSLHRAAPVVSVNDMPAYANMLPTGAQAETIPRTHSFQVTSQASAITSGELFLTAIGLQGGMSLSSISFLSGAVALVTGSNQWFALVDKDFNVLAKTADDTNAAWAANQVKTLAITGGPVVVPATDYYFLGILVVASTVPALVGPNSAFHMSRVAPFLAGGSDTGLTNPASLGATCDALVSSSDAGVYGYLS